LIEFIIIFSSELPACRIITLSIIRLIGNE